MLHSYSQMALWILGLRSSLDCLCTLRFVQSATNFYLCIPQTLNSQTQELLQLDVALAVKEWLLLFHSGLILWFAILNFMVLGSPCQCHYLT